MIPTAATTPDGTKTYAYDTNDQLTAVTSTNTALQQQQTYDVNGNRTDTGYIVIDNRLRNDGTYSYEYDKEGNRTKRTKLVGNSYEVYTWDRRNRLTSVTSFTNTTANPNVKTQQVKYEYDGLDRRIRRQFDATGNGLFTDVDDIKERFVYDTNIMNPSFSEVVQVLDEANNFAVKHRFLNGPELDQVFSDQTADGSIFWLLQDNQQTVTDVAKFGDLNSDGSADTKAKIVDHLTYNAFGKVINADNPQITDSTTDGVMPGLSTAGSPQQSYTGQLFDSATGLLYYDARWFDPFTNQFVSEDPLSFAAGDTNLRRYVGNSNPNATDPSGLDYLEREGNIAVWVIENETSGSIDGPEVGRIDLGVVEGDTVHLRAQFGGGTVPYARLAGYVAAGLRHESLIEYGAVASLNEVSSDQHKSYIEFWINETNDQAGNPCLRAGDRGDENGNVTSYAGANGPLAAGLIVEMMRQVALELAIEFGGAKALTVFSYGGKLFFKQGKDVVELSAEQVAKRLGKNVDDVNLHDIAKQLDGRKFDDVIRPKRVTHSKHHPNSVSPEPKNVDELYKQSLVDDDGVRWAKGPDGTIHRFSKPRNGECHCNGSNAGPNPIRQPNIPENIRRIFR